MGPFSPIAGVEASAGLLRWQIRLKARLRNLLKVPPPLNDTGRNGASFRTVGPFSPIAGVEASAGPLRRQIRLKARLRNLLKVPPTSERYRPQQGRFPFRKSYSTIRLVRLDGLCYTGECGLAMR